MSTLTGGLNVPIKRTSNGAPKPPAKRAPISGFGDDSDEDETFASSTLASGKTSKESQKTKPPKISQYGDLSSSRTSTLHSKSAQDLDPSIYDYDGVYDAIHASKKRKSSPSAEGGSPDDPSGTPRPKARYINNLLASSKIRERDALRAKDRMLAKEREAEGDEFKDKEKFVTAAYKRQQEEMRKAEAEEAEREKEAERRRGKGEGMKALYKNMLEKGEQQHQEVMRKVEEGGDKEGDAVEMSGEDVEKQKQRKLADESGAVINEEGDFVDKRQLLGSGLNVGKGGMKARQPNAAHSQSKGIDGARGERGGREDARPAFEAGSVGARRESESKKMEDELLAMLGS